MALIVARDLQLLHQKMETALAILATLVALVTGELLQNGGFESTDHWDCLNSQCATTGDKHSGQHALKASDR